MNELLEQLRDTVEQDEAAQPTRDALLEMTRAQWALACAIGFAPVIVAGIVLMRCHCACAACTLEISTGILYPTWILLPRR